MKVINQKNCWITRENIFTKFLVIFLLMFNFYSAHLRVERHDFLPTSQNWELVRSEFPARNLLTQKELFALAEPVTKVPETCHTGLNIFFTSVTESRVHVWRLNFPWRECTSPEATLRTPQIGRVTTVAVSTATTAWVLWSRLGLSIILCQHNLTL